MWKNLECQEPPTEFITKIVEPNDHYLVITVIAVGNCSFVDGSTPFLLKASRLLRFIALQPSPLHNSTLRNRSL